MTMGRLTTPKVVGVGVVVVLTTPLSLSPKDADSIEALVMVGRYQYNSAAKSKSHIS
jgi:hypothetical protein